MKISAGTLLCLSALFAAIGCGSGANSGTTTTTNTTPGASNAFVTNQMASGTNTDPQILGYSATSSTSSQTSMINGPVNDTFIGLTTDSSGNLYTIDKSGANGSFTVNEYAAGTNSAGGAATATMRTFTSASITAAPLSMQVDTTGNIYVMLPGGSLLRFAANANESATPSATLTITGSGVFTTDASGNLYATVPVSATDSHNAIAVYAAGYESAATPVRTITPALEMSISSLAVDTSGNVYALGKDTNGNIEIAVFAAGATGTSATTRLITGANTTFISPWRVQVDAAGNIYVADSTSGTAGSAVMIDKFSATANGNLAPTIRIAPAATLSATSSMTVF